MRRLPALVAAALLVVGLFAPLSAGAAASSTPSLHAPSDASERWSVAANHTTNATNWVTLESSDVRRNLSTPSPSLGATLAASDAELRARYTIGTVARRLQAASTTAARERIARRAFSAIETRIRASERRAVAQYHAGAVGERTLVRELALVHARGQAYSRAVDRVLVAGPFEQIENRATALQGALSAFTGPVRGQSLRVFNATRAADDTRLTVYVRASANGAVLASVRRGHYFREIVRHDNRDLSQPRQVGFDDVVDRLADIYPWVSTGQQGGSDINTLTGYSTRRLFRVELNHPYGPMVAYLDAGTADVFREEQSFPLPRIPTTMAGEASSDGLVLTVNRSFTGGPVHVTTRHAATGEAVDATVYLNGQRVGVTGDDGTLWIAAPGPFYSVSARAMNANVSVAVTP